MHYKSSFHGKISEIPGIAVDNFEEHNLRSQAFFLSHCHSDHTIGLDSIQLKVIPSSVFIYTSELTRAVIADQLWDKTILSKLIVLPLGATDITLPKLYSYEEKCLRVTLIPAGHCLGSIMFLFEATNTTVLYTGDFNLSANDVQKIKPLHRNGEPIFLNAIYADTTFINYESFPKRKEVISRLMETISEYLNKSINNRIGLKTSAKYGYEFVFSKIKQKLNMEVYVNEKRWPFYRDNPEISSGITNMEKSAKIHLCDFRSANHSNCVKNRDGLNFLTIRFAAMPWSQYERDGKAMAWLSPNKLEVLFATHCCRTQILNFVNYFPHSKVVGFPNEFSQNSPMKTPSKINLEVTPRKRKMESPGATKGKIMGKKVDRDILRKIFD